jgi:hypothetical protein
VQWGQAGGGPGLPEARPGGGLTAEEPHQLRTADAEGRGGRRDLVAGGREVIEGLGNEHRVVGMVGGDDDPARRRSLFPEGRRAGRIGRQPLPEGERESQPAEGDSPVVGLAATLRGFRSDAGGAMSKDHGRLDLVAMLAAGPAAAGAGLVAVGQQGGVGQGGGMHPSGSGVGSGPVHCRGSRSIMPQCGPARRLTAEIPEPRSDRMNSMYRAMVVVIGLAAAVVVAAAGSDAGEEADMARRLAAAEAGGGRADLATLADQLAAATAAEIRPALTALEAATPAGSNWLRSGLDRAVERLGAELSSDELAAWATDGTLPPRARSLAFGWLKNRDPARADRLLAGMLDETALDLRRAAVAKLLADAAGGGEAAEQAAHRQALVAARDVDQVEAIATWLSEHGEPTDVAEVLGFVRRWRVSGEYDNVGGKGFARVYPPEEGGAAAGDWKEIVSTDRHGEVDLNAAVATKKGVLAYAEAVVEMPAAGPAEIRIGSPCAVVVWVNGQRVMGHEIYHASEAIDQYIGTAEFREGANTVLVKCCQNEQTESWAGEWKFQLRITDPLGQPLARQPKEGE